MGEVEVEVLRDVDLEIAGGELMVIVGPSGSGKTTLLNLIGGLDQPTVGRVWFRDRELSAMARAGTRAPIDATPSASSSSSSTSCRP